MLRKKNQESVGGGRMLRETSRKSREVSHHVICLWSESLSQTCFENGPFEKGDWSISTVLA